MLLAHQIAYPSVPVPPIAALQAGDPAPDVALRLGTERSRLHRWAEDAWAVLFTLHHGDALDRAAETRRLALLLPEFRARRIRLLGIAPFPTPEAGDERLPFAVSYDGDGEAIRRYGLNAAARSVAVIDPQQRLRLQLSHPARRDRDFGEVLRLVTALQQADMRARAEASNWRLRQTATLGAW